MTKDPINRVLERAVEGAVGTELRPGQILEFAPMEELPRYAIEGAPMVHELKCWPSLFEPMAQGRKPFEFRKADRDYMRGDVLHLREWAPVPERYTGRELWAQITYILRGPRLGVPEGYVVMGLVDAGGPP